VWQKVISRKTEFFCIKSMGDRDFGRESDGKHGAAFGGIVLVSGCHFVFALTCDEW